MKETEQADANVAVLLRGLEQMETLLTEVRPEHFELPTPCSEWSVRDLVDHIVESPANFARMMRGTEVDWSAKSRHEDWQSAFRSHAEELRSAWRQAEQPPMPGADFQCAELAVHSWDLARALGRTTADLDPELAERGYGFMRAAMKPEVRGGAFGPEQPAPADADAYDRIAAFAGRSVA